MDRQISFILGESPGDSGYNTQVETVGLDAEEVRQVKRSAPEFTYQPAYLTNQTVLFVRERCSDGHNIGKSTLPLRAIEGRDTADISRCLHAAAIAYLNSKKATFSPDINFEIMDQTRFAQGKRLESQVPK